MPRYIVERTFSDGWTLEHDDDGVTACLRLVDTNSDLGVTWITSFVAVGQRKSFCVYDAPHPEAIRKTAARNSLPIDRITQVTVLDPYFYRSAPITT